MAVHCSSVVAIHLRELNETTPFEHLRTAQPFPTMPSLSYLITGASSGLGANIAIAALAAGHAVIATARNIPKAQQTYPDIERKGGHWLTLDVTSPDTQVIVAEAVQEHNVNVVVNNAGFALRGVLEDLSVADIRAQLETNVLGALAVTKGCLPYLRTHSNRNNAIINISSTSGISGNAAYAAYAASKFALEGASESLAAELATFGVRVILVEPGAFRTNFQTSVQETPLSEAYRGTPAGEIVERMKTVHGKQPGDPVKAARVIVEVVSRGGEVDGKVIRLPLGRDAVQRAYAKIEHFSKNVEDVKGISESVGFDD